LALSVKRENDAHHVSDKNPVVAQLLKYFVIAHLSGARLGDRLTVNSGANLSGADMHGIRLMGADLAYADLTSVNLRGAKMNDG